MVNVGHQRRVRRDLRRLPREEREGAVAGLALELARQLDEGEVPISYLPGVTAQFHAVMQTLAKMQEPAAVLDPVDELAKRRRRRVGSG